MQERFRALLDAAAKVAGSDYKLAQLLGVPRQTLSHWRNGKKPCPVEDQALMASIAGMDPEETLVRAVLEKHANTPKGEKLLTALGNVSRRIGEAVTSVFLGSVGWALAALLVPNKAEAAALAASAMGQAGTGSVAADLLVAFTTMCIMSNLLGAFSGRCGSFPPESTDKISPPRIGRFETQVPF